MEPIQKVNYIGVDGVYVRYLQVPSIPNFNQGGQYTFPYYTNVVLPLGVPIVDLPGCVEAHQESSRKSKHTPNLQEDDPNATYTICPHGQYPSFNAMDFTPDDMTIIREQVAPNVAPPPDPPGTPETPATGDLTEEEVPCPGPNQPRLGTLGPNEKEKVSGYELQADPITKKEICVILYEDIGPIEQYLPSAQIASTTAAIATVAGASALLAKPLADLLLRVVKPAVKQVMTKVNAVLGKTPYRLTEEEKKTNEYRVKKGLLPIPFAKNHQKKEKAQKKIEKKLQKQKKESQKKNPQS